jgi:hypothetical protein
VQYCCCGKSECEEIKALIVQNLPDGHVWKGDYVVVRVTKNATVKVTALLASIVHHLNAPTDLTTYRVARHHWARVVLITQKRRTNFITLKQAKSYDNTDGGHSRHQDPVNKVGNLLHRINQQLSKPSWGICMYRHLSKTTRLQFIESLACFGETIVFRRPPSNFASSGKCAWYVRFAYVRCARFAVG